MAREGDLAVVHFFRCMSREETFTTRLRGLESQATYRADFYSSLPERDFTGAELMKKGYTCTLKNTRNADIMVLTKR